MGASGGETGIIIDQIKNYYIFQKKLNSVLNNEQNNILFNENNSKLKIEEVYLINYDWIIKWKYYTKYDIAKDSFDKIVAENEKDLTNQMNVIFHNLLASGLISKKFILLFENNKNAYNQITRKKIIEPELFECIVDKKTFKLFQEIGEVFYSPSEKKYKIDIILSKKIIILLIKEKCLAKFLYYGNMECENKLIQLTAKYFDKDNEGKNSEKIYNAFIKFLISKDENYLLESFNNYNIGFVKNLFIKLKEGYKIEFQNDNLASKYFDAEKNIKNLNFQNVNKFRNIGLRNIGATCYMNATLECFINVDPLTRYLLTESNYYKIINHDGIFELSSAYCNLLAGVCLDENTNNYFEPYNFKEVISWKNPLFEGVNANDSKDLINFMLEEMNQELSRLNKKDSNQNILKVFNLNQINQSDPVLTFNNFRNDFVQKNDSIIALTFFFIIESKSQCQVCKNVTFNYQSLFLLEFGLEAIYNFYTSKNYNLINNDGKKVINLMLCFEHNKEPVFFVGDNQFYCNICKRQTDNINSNILFSLPPYLIIILNRGKGKSFECEVDFPEYLNLQNYVSCPQSIYNYRLSGVICHLGQSGMSGHFIAYCRQRINNMWYCFNDATVTLCNDQQNDYKNGCPYILFYQSIDKRPNVLFSNDITFDNNYFMNNNQNNFCNNNNLNNISNNINNNNFANINTNNFNNNCMNNFNNMSTSNNMNFMNQNNNNMMINNSTNNFNNNNFNNMNYNFNNFNNNMNNSFNNIINNDNLNCNINMNNSTPNITNNINLINQNLFQMNNNNINGNQNIQTENLGNNNFQYQNQNQNIQNNFFNNNNMMFNTNNNFN